MENEKTTRKAPMAESTRLLISWFENGYRVPIRSDSVKPSITTDVHSYMAHKARRAYGASRHHEEY